MKKGVQRLIDMGNNHLSIWSSQLDDECGNQMIVSEIFSAAILNRLRSITKRWKIHKLHIFLWSKRCKSIERRSFFLYLCCCSSWKSNWPIICSSKSPDNFIAWYTQINQMIYYRQLAHLSEYGRMLHSSHKSFISWIRLFFPLVTAILFACFAGFFPVFFLLLFSFFCALVCCGWCCNVFVTLNRCNAMAINKHTRDSERESERISVQ